MSTVLQPIGFDAPGAIRSFWAFVSKMAANLASNHRRRDTMHKRASELTRLQGFAELRTPERRVGERETVKRLGQLIAAMPAKCRQAFVLYEVEGLPVATIAERTGVPEYIVRHYVVHALLHLRTELDQVDPRAAGDRIHLGATERVLSVGDANVRLQDILAWQAWMEEDSRNEQAFQRMAELEALVRSVPRPGLPSSRQLLNDTYDGSGPLPRSLPKGRKLGQENASGESSQQASLPFG